MAARSNVRGHTRRTASGKTTRVRQHTRRRGLVSPGHSWSLARRAIGAARKRKRVTAAVLGLCCLAELGAWATLSGAALLLATAAVLAGSVAFLAAQASGMPTPTSGGRQAPRRGRQDPKPAPAAGKPEPARRAGPKAAGAATGTQPDQPKPARRVADPAAALGKLGAIWSDDFDAYASGRKGVGEVHCALCQCAPCRCPEFGSPAYFKLLDFRHGRGKKGGAANA